MDFLISKLRLMLELSSIVDSHPSLQKITNDNNYIVVPQDRFEDFLHDICLIFGRAIIKVREPQENEQ